VLGGGTNSVQKALLAATDAIAVAGAGALSQVLRSGDLYPLEPGNWAEAVAVLTMLVAVWIVFARAVGLYRNGRRHELKSNRQVRAAPRWLALVAISFCIHLAPSRLVVGIGLTLTIGSVVAMRTLVRRCIKFFYSRPRVRSAPGYSRAPTRSAFIFAIESRKNSHSTNFSASSTRTRLRTPSMDPMDTRVPNGHASSNGHCGFQRTRGLERQREIALACGPAAADAGNRTT